MPMAFGFERLLGRPDQLNSGDQQDHPDNGLVDVGRQLQRAAQEGEGNRGHDERIKGTPLEVTGAGVAHGGDAGDEDIEGERRWTHHLGGQADEGHGGEIAGGPGVANRGIEHGSEEDQRRQT